MKKRTFTLSHAFLLLAVATIALLSNCSNETANKEKKNTDSLSANSVTNAETDRLLARFDSLDFDVYSHQKWDSLQISHAANILVHYPDGSTTTGIPDHVAKLKPMFVFAPDTKIREHPVKFGINGWTSVIGIVEGTFTQPMPNGNGKAIPPTGKKFKLPMSTIGKWENGKMVEEYLFWDNETLMKQMGIAQ